MNDDCKGTYNDIKKGNEGNKAYNTPALNSTKQSNIPKSDSLLLK